MELRSKLAMALLTAAILAGCSGVAPKAEDAKATAPAAPAPQGETAAKDTPAAKPAETTPVPPATQPPKAPDAPATNPATPATAPPEFRALAFETLQKGAHSGVTDKKAVLVTDEAAWKAQWQQMSATQVPAPAAPALDFSQQAVLAVYMGEQRTGGYAIEITGVELTNGKLRVTVRQTRPGQGAMVTQALTQPFHVVRIPKVPAGTQVEVVW